MTTRATMTPDEKLRADVRELAKACPFCDEGGATAETISADDGVPWRAWLACVHCRATGPVVEGPHGKSDATLRAVTAWNRASRKVRP